MVSMSGSVEKKLRLGVLLSGGGRTMVNLLQAPDLPAEIAVVIASRPCKGIDRAKDAGLAVHLVPYQEYGPERLEDYSAGIAEHLDAAGVDLVILAGFLSMWIIPPNYVGRVMNIHPALLPGFGGHGMYGRRVHEAVLAAGCKVSGCTVHFVTNDYDEGPIIVQKTVPVFDTDTPDALAARVFEQECAAYPEAIRLFAEGRLTIDGRIVKIKQYIDHQDSEVTEKEIFS
ncbi:MAG: phosphoribosylglycinamide formyltransferase [Phycisphaerae bacterium]|nr:phosphoribosylglycinamide formyltransferase [Phycisphaerae bacterium]